MKHFSDSVIFLLFVVLAALVFLMMNCVVIYRMVISVWGVVFLGLLGVFFYIRAVTLFPDLHFPEESEGGARPLTTA